MAKKQTRRSISLKGTTYARIKRHCEETGESISGYLEKVAAQDLTAKGVPEWSGPLPRPSSRRNEPVEEIAAAHFTF